MAGESERWATGVRERVARLTGGRGAAHSAVNAAQEVWGGGTQAAGGDGEGLAAVALNIPTAGVAFSVQGGF